MKYLQTFRLHPTPEQAAKIRERFALAGAAYNWGLDETERVWEEEHRHLSLFDIKDCYRHHFNYEQHRTVTNAELNALNNLDFAYQSYFKRLTDKPHAKEPEKMVSYTEMASAVLPLCDSRHIYLPKVGRVLCNFYRPIQHQPTQVTVKERNGKFYAVLLADMPEEPYREQNPQVVGIDLGLKTFATLSDGKEIPFPEHIWNKRSERREAHLQRIIKRRTDGSNRQKKAARRYARFTEHKANQVKEFHLKTAVRLCQDYGGIAVEHLNVEDMKQGHNCHARNKDFQHYGLTAFLHRLHNRCLRTGTYFLQIGRYEPTTRLCHNCGYLMPHALPLDQREWTCPNCHQTHQRDVNAALNIQALGQRILPTLPPVERKVTTAEQPIRLRREAVKVAEKPKAKPQPACTIGASKHNVSRLAVISTEKRTLTPSEFLTLASETIRPPKICQLLGIKQTQLNAMYHQINTHWRKEMMQEKCEHLRRTVIKELTEKLPPLDGTDPTAYVNIFLYEFQEYIRITKIGHDIEGMQPYVSKKNRHRWHECVKDIIESFKNIIIH